MSQFILHTFECTPLPDAEYKVVNKDLPHFYVDVIIWVVWVHDSPALWFVHL